jgi:hypothetical protein
VKGRRDIDGGERSREGLMGRGWGGVGLCADWTSGTYTTEKQCHGTLFLADSVFVVQSWFCLALVHPSPGFN